MSENTQNWDEMSDDDFLQAESPTDSESLSEELRAGNQGSVPLEDTLSLPVEDDEPEEGTVEEPTETEEEAASSGSDDVFSDESHQSTPKQEEEPDVTEPVSEEQEEEKTDEPIAAKDTKPADETDDDAAKTETAAVSAVNYEDAYKQIMAPFKANGREFTPENPDEVIRLMQQGANYIKKMTALKPNLKLMRMLENNNLLDEAKINFMIDLQSRDKTAIEKLLKDSNMDPMDLDTSEEPSYRPGNHTVSDQEMEFHSVLEDVMSNPEGKTTVSLINDTWDAQSKEAIFKDPKIMSLINEHRGNGIYDRISGEIEKQQALGNLSTNTPFVEAYRTVGDALHAQGRLVPGSEQGQPAQAPAAPVQQQTTPQPVGTRSSKRNVASNGDRAKAASPSRSTPQTSSKKEFDPFSMTDDEILAATSPRI